jgi:hypothetical protein
MPAKRSFAAILLALALAAGCSSDKPTAPSDNTITRRIDDLNYVHGRYFFLKTPAEELADGGTIDFATLRVFVDDMNGSNNQGGRIGSGEIDPTLAPGDSPRLAPLYFDPLQEGADYEVTVVPYGDRFPVLILKQALSSSQVLAVAYEEVLPGGARRAVGSVPDCAGDLCAPVRLRMIQAPGDVYLAKVGAPDDYETDSTIPSYNQIREHELKNVYDLGFPGVDPGRLEIEVGSYAAGDTLGGFFEGGSFFDYLQVIGVDDDRDARVDPFYFDRQRGTLMFPDLRPFDPRLPGRPDARSEELEFFRSRLDQPGGVPAVPGYRGHVFWPEGAASPPGSSAPVTPAALVANPRVYDRRNILVTRDRRYSLLVRGPRL